MQKRLLFISRAKLNYTREDYAVTWHGRWLGDWVEQEVRDIKLPKTSPKNQPNYEAK